MPAHDESAEFGDGVVVVPKSCRIRGIGSTGRKCTGDHKDASLNLMPCRLNEGGAMAPRVHVAKGRRFVDTEMCSQFD